MCVCDSRACASLLASQSERDDSISEPMSGGVLTVEVSLRVNARNAAARGVTRPCAGVGEPSEVAEHERQ
jgi:hypothetical protein